jgi:hypothetical protein
MSDCTKDSCQAPSSGSAGSCGSSGKCPCGTDCGGDPMSCAQALWCSSFGQALRQVHVEALKVRIQKAWGPMIDQGADLVVEAMGAAWQAKMSEAKAMSDLKAKMAALMFGKK